MTKAANLAALASGPAFYAQIASPQAIPNNTFTKASFTLEGFDTNSNYDASNSRFLPTVAGYYQVNISAAVDGGTAGTVAAISVMKNGSTVSTSWFATAAAQYSGAHISHVVYCNGSTDYIEAYFFHNAGAGRNTLAGLNSGFSAALVRAA